MSISIRQHSLHGILAVWALAAIPMALGAWVVAPWLNLTVLPGTTGFVQALVLTMTAGLVWQFVLVLLLVRREQGRLDWPTLRGALWLQKPTDPSTGEYRPRLWWLLIPLSLGFFAESLIPDLAHAGIRDIGVFLESTAGQAFFDGNWLWYAITLVLMLCNTVFGEELLFRGWLLPRMSGVFGRRDWLANGVLFAAYHLHVPWVIPATLLDSFLLSYPVRRYRSAWFGIIVHSTQTVFIGIALLVVVL